MNAFVIAAAARAVAEAEVSHAVATEALSRARQDRADIADRAGAISVTRADIVARRRAGDARDDDGAMLALLAADAEGLATLLAEADAAEIAVRAPFDAATAVLVNARFQLARAQDEAVEIVLVDHASKLDAALLATIGELEAVGKRVGRTGRPLWGASRMLYDRLRSLAAVRGEL